MLSWDCSKEATCVVRDKKPKNGNDVLQSLELIWGAVPGDEFWIFYNENMTIF